MYLAEVSSWEIVKKQYRYKLRSYFGVFSSLVVIQILASFFSLNGTGMSGGSSGTFSYNVYYYSGDLILAFVMIWGFITAIIITTKAYRYDDYSFVTNRKISHFSNILFLMSASLFAGITVFLSSHLYRLLAVYVKHVDGIMMNQLTITQILKGVSATVLYIFLFVSIGYFVGMLIQVNRLFSFLIPVGFIGFLIMDGLHNDPTLLQTIALFFGSEALLTLLFVKTIAVSALFYVLAILISNRMEVRS